MGAASAKMASAVWPAAYEGCSLALRISAVRLLTATAASDTPGAATRIHRVALTCSAARGSPRGNSMMKGGFAPVVAALIAWLVVAASAQAQTATRAWVSGHGTDAAGCGTPTAPCRSLQYAHDNIVAAFGEIDILDPAGYGAVSITKAISIINDSVGTAGVQAATGTAIAINVPSNAFVT